MQITGYTDNYSTISIIYESGRVVNVKENNGTSTSDPYGLYYNNGIPARLDHYSESYRSLTTASKTVIQSAIY